MHIYSIYTLIVVVRTLFESYPRFQHPGCFKTLELVFQNYWWPNMLWYVGMYISHCDLCLHTKIQHCLLTGELQPLLILEEHWDVISVDFISELLESGGYNSVMVAIDSVGKHSHFVD